MIAHLMAAPFSPAQPASVKLGAADPVERWGQLTLQGNLASERGEGIKARQSYSEALAVAEEMMVAAARSHDARAARFAPALYGISCNDIIALAHAQGDALTAGIFLCKLAGGYLSVMESTEAPIALRTRCLLHSRVASATLCSYFEERGMWDAAETYSARANAAFFSLQAQQQNPAAGLPVLPSELPSLLLADLPEASLLLPEPSAPPEPSQLQHEPSQLQHEPSSAQHEPSLPQYEASLLPEPSAPPPSHEARLPPEPSALPPRIPRPARPIASPVAIEPSIASSLEPPPLGAEPAAASFEPLGAPSVYPPLPTLDSAPPSAPRGLAPFGEACAPLPPWEEPQPELRPSLWSDANPALDLSPPQPPPRRTWGARILDWAARVFRRSPRSTLPSLGSRSA